jgi:anti-sigma B factor antagonist
MSETDPSLRHGGAPRRPTGPAPAVRRRAPARGCRAAGDHRRVSVVTLRGDIDMAAAEDLRDCLDRALERDTHVVVDLTGVTLLDCHCLGILIRARQRALRHDRPVCLAVPSGPAARVLRLTALDAVFDTFPDRHGALAHANQSPPGDRPS